MQTNWSQTVNSHPWSGGFSCKKSSSRYSWEITKNELSNNLMRHWLNMNELCVSFLDQVLVRLCSHASPAEELARKDDLTLLFSAITSWCPSHNVPWRKSAAEVLMTLSRHGLTPNVVQYIHSKLALPCWGFTLFGFDFASCQVYVGCKNKIVTTINKKK